MTITPKPEREQILAAAIEAGLIGDPEDALDLGLEALRTQLAFARKKETPEEWIARVPRLDSQP
jgi:hypothetical protein